jgi:hypothetical protein
MINNLTAAAIAITDSSLIQKIYEVLPPNLQEQIRNAYPSLFEEKEIVGVGKRYINDSGESFILAHEQGHVALVSLENGRILDTVRVANVNDLTENEITQVFGDFDDWMLDVEG